MTKYWKGIDKMTVISLVLGGIVFTYTVAYTIKRLTPIIHFSRCRDSGEMQTTEGHIFEKNAEENKAFQGAMVNICLPKFEYVVGGKKRYYQSTVRYHNASIGQTAEIGFCERTGEAWVIKDIPLMKKDLLIRVTTILALLIVLILTEIML